MKFIKELIQRISLLNEKIIKSNVLKECISEIRLFCAKFMIVLLISSVEVVCVIIRLEPVCFSVVTCKNLKKNN